jgi:hypothetical protein
VIGAHLFRSTAGSTLGSAVPRQMCIASPIRLNGGGVRGFAEKLVGHAALFTQGDECSRSARRRPSVSSASRPNLSPYRRSRVIVLRRRESLACFAENCGAAHRALNERTRWLCNSAVFETVIVRDVCITEPHFAAPLGLVFAIDKFEQGSLRPSGDGVSRGSTTAPGTIEFTYRREPAPPAALGKGLIRPGSSFASFLSARPLYATS